MAKKGNDSPQIITANRLDDGIVVYFATDKDAVQWVEKIADASVLIGEALNAALSRAEQAVEANEVVEVNSCHRYRPSCATLRRALWRSSNAVCASSAAR